MGGCPGFLSYLLVKESRVEKNAKIGGGGLSRGRMSQEGQTPEARMRQEISKANSPTDAG